MGLIQLANVRNNLCLDATVNGGGSGTNVVQGACLSNQTKEGYNQQWLYHVETSTIRPYYNISLCLDAPSSSNGRLVVDDCGSFSQLWVFPGTISSSGVGAVSIPSPPPPPPPPPLHSLTSNIISATSGTQPLCIDQTGSGTIDVTTCNSATAGAALNQMFKFAFTPIASVPGLYNMGAIQLANGGSSNSNLCLDATANGGGSGTSVIQGACQSIQTQAGYNQQWFYHVRTSTIRPFYSASLCLDVNGSSSGGKTLVVTNCVGSFSQIWSFLSTSTPTPPPPPPVQSPTVVHNNNNIAKVDAVRIVTVALQPDTKPSTTVTTTTAIQKPTTTTIVPVSIATVTTCAADCHNHPIKNRCARGKQCKLVAKASLANHHCPVYKCL